MIGCFWTSVRKQPIITFYFEFGIVLQFYYLEVWFSKKHVLTWLENNRLGCKASTKTNKQTLYNNINLLFASSPFNVGVYTLCIYVSLLLVLLIQCIKRALEYDHELPDSQQTLPWLIEIETLEQIHTHRNNNTIKVKQPALSSLIRWSQN